MPALSTQPLVVTEGRFTRPKSRERLLSIIDKAHEQLLARAGGSATIGP